MGNTKDITAMELARYNNCTVQNVRKYFKKKGLDYKLFEDVKAVKHYARFYLFVVDADLAIPD